MTETITAAAYAAQSGRKRRKRRKVEEVLHLAVARYLRVALSAPAWWSSIDHGAGKMSRASAGLRKARGAKAGIPDVLVFYPEPPFVRVVAIELKADRGRLSPEQKETIGALQTAGVRCGVARSIEDVETLLRINGVPVRATAGLRLSRAAA